MHIYFKLKYLLIDSKQSFKEPELLKNRYRLIKIIEILCYNLYFIALLLEFCKCQ